MLGDLTVQQAVKRYIAVRARKSNDWVGINAQIWSFSRLEYDAEVSCFQRRGRANVSTTFSKELLLGLVIIKHARSEDLVGRKSGPVMSI